MLEIKDLHVSVGSRKIVRGVDIRIRKGEIHALMGPNGSGKSTLAMAVMGHPKYAIDKGDVIVNGESVLGTPANERARKGLFLSFQYPPEVPGVSITNFLRVSANAVSGTGQIQEFVQIIKERMAALKMDENFAKRHLNDGFSGGEKKKNEMLQMSVLNPRIAILDETDSGLDIDALKIVAACIKAQAQEMGILLITHHSAMLKHITPDFVHVMVDGRIVKSGDASLAREIEKRGYEELNEHA